MNEVHPTFKHAMRIWWSYCWRSLLMAIPAAIIGGILGFICGFILGAVGVPVATIKLMVMPISFIMGLCLSVFPIYWILGKDFGAFRLVLVSTRAPEEPPT